MRPCRLKTGFYNLATNPVLSHEFIMDTSFFMIVQLELVITNVLLASKLKNLSKRSKHFKNTQDIQISGTSSSGAWEGRRGTHTQTHSEGPCQGGSDRIQTHVCREGGGGEKQGEKEGWEDARRERENGEK